LDRKLRRVDMDKGGEKVTLFPGMAGVTRDMISKMKTEGVELFSVDIMVTQRCNFRCIYCYAEGAPEKVKQLTMEEAKSIVRDCVSLRVRVVNLQGGEPLIWHPNDFDGPSGEAFFHLVEYIKDSFERRSLDVSIVSFTDVAVITEEKAKRLAGLKLSLCCKLDSLNEQIQDRLLGCKGGTKKIKEGFKNLMKVGYGEPNVPPLSTNTVVTVINYNDVPEVFRWSRRHGFRPFVIPVHVHGRAKDYSSAMLCGKAGVSTLDSADIRGLFEKLAEIDGKEFGIYWKPESPWVENKACSRHLGGIHVRSDGIVVPCSEAPDYWALGEIRKTSLKELVFSEKVKKFRDIYSQLHQNSKCSPKICSLSAERKCYGCRTRAYDDLGFDENGNFDPTKLDPEAFFAGDPACWRNVKTI
jgi:radical SAM protein with 4Fe4S-binding SPASM domain